MADTNGSFYANGLAYGTAETGLGNVPASPTPTLAPSSFYQSGSVYNTLVNSDALLAAITAQQVLATNAAGASLASQIAAAASAASAAATLAGSLLKASNLSDLANVATAKINLALVKGDVGLSNVDNTSDVNKPVSTAQAAADALKANLASPTFTGVPAAPTAAAATNTTQLATTAFVEAARVILAASDALKAPLASPALTGVPTAPTAAAATNTTQLATTAFVEAARVILAASDALKAPLASPALTGVPTAPTAAVATNTTQLATTAFVLANAGTGLPAAVKADQVAATSNTVSVTPGTQKFHPLNAKAWAYVTQSGGSYTLAAGSGIASITKAATGRIDVVPSVAFSSTNFGCVITPNEGVNGIANELLGSRTTTNVRVNIKTSSTLVDTDSGFTVLFFGDL